MIGKKNEKWQPMPRFLLRKSALRDCLKPVDLAQQKCLEIGFGAGEILGFLSQKGALVHGFDFSDKANTLAKSRLRTLKSYNNIKFIEKEQEIPENYFDIVMAFEVLEHIQKDRQAVEKWLSFVKPGGSLIFSVPAHESKWSKNDDWAGHEKRYEREDFERLCEGVDVHIKSVWNYGYPLTIVLDRLLNVSSKSEIESSDKIEKTKRSGIERNSNLFYKLLSNDIVLFPFYLIQRIFFNKDLSSAYIVHLVKDG